MKSNQISYPNFKWTFSTLGCPTLSLEEICALAKDFDITQIEARAIENTVDLPALFQSQFQSPENLARYLKDQNVEICGLDTSLKLISSDSDSRQAFLEFLPWAEAIGTKSLRVFDGGTVSEGLSDEAFTQAQETIDWWRSEKESSQWTADIAIETHDALVGQNSCRRLIQENPDIKIIWDTHHTWKKAGEPIQTSWNTLGPNVVNVHIKDSISKASARHPFTYVNLNEGEFPLDDTLQLLAASNYDGYVSIEWERMWHPYLSDLKNALQDARDLNWF